MSTQIDDTIVVPGHPDVPGLRFRHFRGTTDYAGMAAANQAARDAAGILDVVDVEGLARQYAHLVNSEPRDDILVVEIDGRIVGYARTEWRDATDGTRSFDTVCLVHPDVRNRGIGGAMLDWQERRLAVVAAGLPADRRSVMRAFTWDTDPGAAPLLESRGWAREGRGYEMVRPTLDEVPVVPLPDGFEVRPIAPSDDRRVWDAAAEAFRDERGEGEWSEEDWAHDVEDPRRDPTLWAIAFDGDEVAGGVHGRIDAGDNAYHDVLQGYIAGVWTRRPYRRRGLARALLARVLVLLRERGMTSAYLGVDGLNPNQALTLYESLGFEIHTSETDWTKPLGAGGASSKEAR